MRGGRREGAGRPPVPDSERLTHVVSLRAAGDDVRRMGALVDEGATPLEVLRAGLGELEKRARRKLTRAASR